MVIRPEARDLIYQRLVALAGADDFHEEEVRLLNRVAVHWGFVTAEAAAAAEARMDAEAAPEPEPEGQEEFDLLS